MSTSTGTGITWREFYRFLTSTAGCVEVSWTPGTHITLRQPNGREFTTCKPEKVGEVSVNHFVDVANAFGKSQSDMEIWMGRRPTGRSKMTAKRAERAVKRTQSVIRVDDVHELASRVQAIGRSIFQSPACRTASLDRRRELQGIISRLEAWFRTESGKAA